MVPGDTDDGERASDVYLEFSQPLSEIYTELYNVAGGVIYWRGKVDERGGVVQIDDGIAISESPINNPLDKILSLATRARAMERSCVCLAF